LENAVDGQKWLDGVIEKIRSGSPGELTWPLPLNERMGAQLSLFRSFSDQTMDPAGFGFHFFRRQGDDFDAVVSNINSQLFSSLSRDLRRYILRIAASAEPQDHIPASDRIVRIDHNSQSYNAAIEAVDRLEELIRQANDYEDLEDKEQRLAEISAGRRLLQAVRVRVAAAAQALAAPIRSLLARFGTGLINQAAHDAWDKLTTLLGSGWHWPF